jgi:hypothetical protein
MPLFSILFPSYESTRLVDCGTMCGLSKLTFSKSRLELTPGTVLLDPLHMKEHVILVCAILQIFSALEPGIGSLIDSRS